MIDNLRLNELFRLYYEGNATEAETGELMRMIEEASEETMVDLLQQTWKDNVKVDAFFGPEVRQKMLSGLKAAEPVVQPGAGVVRRMPFWKYAAAAAVLVVVSMVTFLLMHKDVQAPVAQKQKTDSVVNDIVPGGDRAVLTLADGQKIILDTASNGSLARQGGITIINLEGQLAYQPEGESTEVLYNTVTTPRGGQYQLVLADGSKVWLNAASSLRFPTAFPGGERVVELTGEGYFEVAHNAAKPFHVKVADMDVQVLGTHFNINSYDDEPAIKTTLLEGAVKVSKHATSKIIKPGEQAVVPADAVREGYLITVKGDVDVEGVIAWKNGYFHFEGSTLKEVMRQIARWYQVDVLFEGPLPNRKFGGDIARSASLNDVLKVLRESNIGFKVNGRKITVTR